MTVRIATRIYHRICTMSCSRWILRYWPWGLMLSRWRMRLNLSSPTIQSLSIRYICLNWRISGWRNMRPSWRKGLVTQTQPAPTAIQYRKLFSPLSMKMVTTTCTSRNFVLKLIGSSIRINNYYQPCRNNNKLSIFWISKSHSLISR